MLIACWNDNMLDVWVKYNILLKLTLHVSFYFFSVAFRKYYVWACIYFNGQHWYQVGRAGSLGPHSWALNCVLCSTTYQLWELGKLYNSPCLGFLICQTRIIIVPASCGFNMPGTEKVLSKNELSGDYLTLGWVIPLGHPLPHRCWAPCHWW